MRVFVGVLALTGLAAALLGVVSQIVTPEQSRAMFYETGPFERASPWLWLALAALIAWCHGLGIETFVGSSGRVFPTALKASPLLRAWLGRLAGLGVTIHARSRWLGWDSKGQPLFSDAALPEPPAARAIVLALGGASWPRLGSDGEWPALLDGIGVTPWAPMNMGFAVAWSDHFASRFQGTPLKRIGLRFGPLQVRGEAMVTRDGIEGGAVYALSGPIRDAIAMGGPAIVELDLRPDLSSTEVTTRLADRPRADSTATRLRKALGLPPVAIGLVQEALHAGVVHESLAALVKAVPIRLLAPSPIARAISSAGGLQWSELDGRFMLKAMPGTFACGEMLDWEAPTGGYLLQGCFSTGVAAARGALAWLDL
jgi:uncharacterized flavoprotein (TIGR03862 family)